MVLRFTSYVLVGATGMLAMGPATSAEVELNLSGSAFEGGPAFEAAIGGQVVGTGTVENPVPQGTPFRFEVDDQVLEGASDFTVRLTNDYSGGEGQDRNLSILAARVGAVGLTPEDFILTSGGEPIERDAGAGVQIWSGDESAVANAPAGGWLGAGAASDREGQGAPAACTAGAEVTGFDRNEFVPETDPSGNLGDLASQAISGACSVTITGYADETGSDVTNRRITAARAGAVLDQLLESGADFPAANIVPTEGTTEFGADPAANRRVNVRLWSPQAPPSGPVAGLLRDGQDAGLEQALILGWQSNGELYIRSSNTDPKEVLWLLEQAKVKVLAGEPIQGPGE